MQLFQAIDLATAAYPRCVVCNRMTHRTDEDGEPIHQECERKLNAEYRLDCAADNPQHEPSR